MQVPVANKAMEWWQLQEAWGWLLDHAKSQFPSDV